MEPRSTLPKLDGILAGSDEPVFRVLPQRVLEDMKYSRSESSLVWNSIYPRAQPTLELAQLLSLTPLWGSSIEPISDRLIPYYWGFNQEGVRLRNLDRVLDAIDGPGPRTEADLFLLGEGELVLVEAKRMARLGRCGRYGSARCPEIHGIPSGSSCRYWAHNESLFSAVLDLGLQPERDDPAPACDAHYQLARSTLIGTALAKRLKRRLHLWLIVPRKRWGALERDWIDFSERIKDDRLWRRLRVLAWEDIHTLGQLGKQG